MTAPQASLAHHVAALLATGAPLSFLDAWAVVRRAQREGEVNAETVAALLAMHDHPLSTRGAKDVLADYLRATQRRVAQQCALAERPLKLRDFGKVARVCGGGRLTLQLPRGAW